jgi:hypothetical protein
MERGGGVRRERRELAAPHHRCRTWAPKGASWRFCRRKRDVRDLDGRKNERQEEPSRRIINRGGAHLLE